MHLVAKYKVLDVFKGDVDKGDTLIVTDTCLDEPVPDYMLGYPGVKDYCRGRIGLSLTGVNADDGTPLRSTDNELKWILFLKNDIRKGVPQLTWLENSRTAYYGGCRRALKDIPENKRSDYTRMLKQMKLNKQDNFHMN